MSTGERAASQLRLGSMVLAYIAGKFTARNAWEIESNVRAAEEVGYQVALVGAMPVIPHANTRYFHGTITPDFWYAGTMELLRRCDVVVLVPGWEDSKGALAEVAEAKHFGIPVFVDARALGIYMEARYPLRPLPRLSCPACGLEALRGHLTCGKVECDEMGHRYSGEDV